MHLEVTKTVKVRLNGSLPLCVAGEKRHSGCMSDVSGVHRACFCTQFVI